MMKSFLQHTIILLFLYIATVLGAQSISVLPSIHPDYPGKCYISETEVYEPGVHTLQGCVGLYCSDDGYVKHESCGAFGYPPNCIVVPVSQNAAYPECCKVKFVCTDENGKEYELKG